MKTGVSMAPCRVVTCPRRALEPGSDFNSSNMRRQVLWIGIGLRQKNGGRNINRKLFYSRQNVARRGRHAGQKPPIERGATEPQRNEIDCNSALRSRQAG